MKLVSAKCPNCGANLQLDSEKTDITCEYCGQTIAVQEAVEKHKLEVSGTISIDGITSNSELISAANNLLEMKEYLKAKRKFQEFSEKCPNDYQGWLGSLICRTRNFSIKDNNILFENEVNNYYEHFLATAPDEIKEQYQEEMDIYFGKNKNTEDDNKNQKQKKSLSNSEMIKWGLAGFLWLAAFSVLGNLLNGNGSFLHFIYAILLIITAGLACPAITTYTQKYAEYTKNKTKIVIVSVISLIIVMLFLPTQSLNNKTETNEITNSTTNVEKNKDVNDSKQEKKNENVTKKENKKETKKEAKKEPTLGEKNALKKAQDYLAYMAFSYKGLIKQLEFEGFSKKEAKYGVDNCGANWKKQAAKKAKEYMNYSAFSKKALINQLKYEGFTKKQAEYGAKSVGY